ncbi:MAG TPA: hypothetical protein VGY97_08490 [Solirubrobacteraceae bacterium]|nr:hypothetical protein [Solirubrobacteraceae bacterium]
MPDGVELALPELTLARHPVGGVGEWIGSQAETVRSAHDRPLHDAGVLQHPEMPRDGGFRDAEVARRRAHRRGALRQSLDDPTPDRVRQREKALVEPA